MTINLSDARTLQTTLDGFKVPRSPDLEKALAVAEAVQTLEPALPQKVSDLDAAGLSLLLPQLAAFHEQRFYDAGRNRLQMLLEREAYDYLTAHVPTIIESLRPAFDKAAAEVWKAAQAGIRPNMTAEDIIDLDSPTAIQAWRGLGQHFTILSAIGGVRIQLSTMLMLPPQITPSQVAIGDRVDYTACFVDPSTKLTGGYGNGLSPWRWLSLALATGGQLRLNTPAETLALLHGDGVSPGFVVCAASCVVTDDAGRQLMLYRNDWIPSWVDDDQRDRIVDDGLAVAAQPEAIRPGDQYPAGTGASKQPRRVSPGVR